jgi:dipeptidyl aminopeptidase/acylaminoacyl peptidase
VTEQELRELLRNAPLDLEPKSEQRAWHAVRGAYQLRPAPRSRWTARRSVVAVATIAIAALIALGAVTGPRQAVAHWLRDAFGLSAQPHITRGLNGLPGGGRLLIETAHGPWLVNANGTRRGLGTYTGAAWSPHSLYVVAWRGVKLAALNLAGVRQWELTAPEEISSARWSPDGYRIAFLAGAALHVVAADSSGEHTLSNAVAPIPPTWQPRTGGSHRLTLVTSAGAIEQIDADTDTPIWSAHPGEPARRLLWSPRGDLLLVLGTHELSEYNSAGSLLTRMKPGGATIESAAFTSQRKFALVIRPTRGRPDSIELLSIGPNPAAKILYTGLERVSDLNASPNRKWLLAASPSADEWIFIRIPSPGRLLASTNITDAFQRRTDTTASFPQLAGWQR